MRPVKDFLGRWMIRAFQQNGKDLLALTGQPHSAAGQTLLKLVLVFAGNCRINMWRIRNLVLVSMNRGGPIAVQEGHYKGNSRSLKRIWFSFERIFLSYAQAK